MCDDDQPGPQNDSGYPSGRFLCLHPQRPHYPRHLLQQKPDECRWHSASYPSCTYGVTLEASLAWRPAVPLHCTLRIYNLHILWSSWTSVSYLAAFSTSQQKERWDPSPPAHLSPLSSWLTFEMRHFTPLNLLSFHKNLLSTSQVPSSDLGKLLEK